MPGLASPIAFEIAHALDGRILVASMPAETHFIAAKLGAVPAALPA